MFYKNIYLPKLSRLYYFFSLLFFLSSLQLTCIAQDLSKSTPLSDEEKNLTQQVKNLEDEVQELQENTGKIRPLELESNLVEDESTLLSLRATIEQGLRENPKEKIRNKDEELLQINWDMAHDKFWYPNIRLFAKSSEKTIGRIFRDNSEKVAIDKIGNNEFGLALGEYTIFNWGKDYLDHLNSKTLYNRKSKYLYEKRRDLKLSLIMSYFNLVRLKKNLRSYRLQLRRSSFLYRLAKEKAALKKIPQYEFFEARAQYLRSYQEYHEAKIDAQQFEKEISILIGDTPSNTYRPAERLKFVRLSLNKEKAINLAIQKNSSYLNAKAYTKITGRKAEIALKDLLPLPKFTLDLGTYTHAFSQSGHGTHFRTSSGGKNFDVRAQINMSWDIFGERGFFNTRKTKKTLVEKEIAVIKEKNIKHNILSKVRSSYRSISTLESQINVVYQALTNNRKSFDLIMTNYLKKQASFTRVKDALILLRDSEIAIEDVKFRHLKEKIQLAKIIGIEDFPGEQFERLGIREY